MSLLTVAIFLVILILVGIYVLGVSGEFIENATETITEQIEKQNDQTGDGTLTNTGNFASDTNTRICDLRIRFVGLITDNILGKPYLIMGNHLSLLSYDMSEIKYQWLCDDIPAPLSVIGWKFDQFSESKLLLLGSSSGETIRFKFQGVADNGKLLFDESGKTQFQASTKIKEGANYPVAFIVSAYLKDVTEDNYTIEYKSQKYTINDVPANTVHEYYICKPGASC